MKFLAGVLTVFFFTALILLGLTGTIPTLSNLLGVKQKDLGITVTPDDSTKATEKVGTLIDTLPINSPLGDNFKLEGKRPTEYQMDSKELTALYNNRPWVNFPVKNVQIKIQPDGLVEGSAILTVEKLLPWAVALGYSESQVREAIDRYRLPTLEIPFYFRAYGGVEKNQSDINLTKIQVGAISLPTYLITSISNEAEKFTNDLLIKKQDNVNIEYLRFQEGQMYFKGEMPEKEYVAGE